ncbi:hypothetical protein HDV57DRAFT_46910 [Trichoderma longibrachiatum]|uniref:Uncharacterized protein n=1 Tax=Trichoderma longibrachiatum ATCC 18648 TaxID=983965 RepID=A0A2T4CH80_TRILO|nr:hypothetical protein M440DRAFT_70675 [Trichoderma longibrachiatum ATCC 18648]
MTVTPRLQMRKDLSGPAPGKAFRFLYVVWLAPGLHQAISTLVSHGSGADCERRVIGRWMQRHCENEQGLESIYSRSLTNPQGSGSDGREKQWREKDGGD